MASASAGMMAVRRFSSGSSVRRTQPVAGNHPSVSASIQISRIAIMKLGTASRPKLVPVMTRSAAPPARNAESVPSGIEAARAMTMASTPISRVTGRRSPIASVTDWPVRYDRPRSPVTASPSQAT